MSAETNFRELFRKMIDQFQLSPGVAKLLLQRILDILLREEQDAQAALSDKEESEEANL